MRHLAIAGVCLAWTAASSFGKLDNSQSQFDYRGHHDEAAAKAVGRSVAFDPIRVEESHLAEGAGGGAGGGSTTAPRLRERSSREKQEPERWAQYVPDSARSIAAEISEARREAREMETKRLRAEHEEERKRQEKEENDAKKSRSSLSTLQSQVQKVKSVTKKTGKRAQSKVKQFLDDDGDDEDEEDDDDDDDDGQRTRRRRKKNSIWSRFWSGFVWVVLMAYRASAWSGRNLIWTPILYAAEAVRWSAHTSWKTTRWTGERAFVGPALTAGAPLIYLFQGSLFIFVFIPVRIASVVAREVYPIYIYLGAALAVGTAMGLASALILYIGSFLFNDSSSVEQNLSHRAEMIPNELKEQFRQRKKKLSPAKKWAKKGEGIIERAIKESQERRKRASRKESHDNVISPEDLQGSDEDDDDYFGSASTFSTYKGKARSNDVTPTESARRTPTHFGPPLPVGATGQGGWNSSRGDSTNSTPVTSPLTLRANLPYSSSRINPVQSPLTSPDILRSASSRQRRGINSSA